MARKSVKKKCTCDIASALSAACAGYTDYGYKGWQCAKTCQNIFCNRAFCITIILLIFQFQIAKPDIQHGSFFSPTDKPEAMMKENPCVAITISRQMGSGGSYIGYRVAKELGFKYIDREILRRAAELLGTEVSYLENYDEKSSNFIEKFIRGFSFGSPEAAGIPPLRQPVYDKDLFTLECKIMNEILNRHSAVFIGRGGFYALKDRKVEVVFRILIHAPQEFRIKRIMKVQNISEMQKVRSVVEASDVRRAMFIKDMVGVDWMDARNYHLCIDSSAVGFSPSVEMIVRLATKGGVQTG
jgi:cytidylate kinase